LRRSHSKFINKIPLYYDEYANHLRDLSDFYTISQVFGR